MSEQELTIEEVLKICQEKYELGVVFAPIYGRAHQYTSAGLCNIHDEDAYNITVLVMEKADTDDNTVSIFSKEKGYALILDDQTTLAKIQEKIDFIEKRIQ
jgi:hypothetical protein